MSITPVVAENNLPLPQNPAMIAGEILSHILGPCLQSFIRSHRKRPFGPFDVDLPVDLIDEHVNQTSVNNIEKEIREDARADLKAYINELHQQRI